MPSPQTLLSLLLGAAIAAGGILQGLHWRTSSAAANLPDLEKQLRIAAEENEMLKRENASLRSLAQGGGELAVPQDLIDRTEKEFGLRFLSSPVIHKLAREELRDRISAAIESRLGPSGIDDREESYKLIGWLRKDDDLLSQLTALKATGARAWFDDTSGEAWVTDRFDLKNIPDQGALVRVLAQVLLYQRFPPSPSYPGDDADRARQALHQGAATGYEARLYAASARTLGFISVTPDHEAELILSSLSPFLQGLNAFPEIQGKGFADSLFVQGSTQLLDAFRRPPQTTHAIISPAAPSTEPLALPLPEVPETPFLTESAGQLGLSLWIAALADPDTAAGIAADWKNDRYLLFPDGESSSAILWDIELGSPKAADQFQEIALKRIATMAGQATAALGQASISPENRHLQLTRLSPTRLRFLNTAVAATAATLANTPSP